MRYGRGFSTPELLVPLVLLAIAVALTAPILAALRAQRVPSVLLLAIAGGAWLICAAVWLRALVPGSKQRMRDMSSRSERTQHESRR